MTSRRKQKCKALLWWRYLCKLPDSVCTRGMERAYNWMASDRNRRSNE